MTLKRIFQTKFLLVALLSAAVTGISNQEPAIPKILVGEDRYLVHVFTDKPIYRENESVKVRAVVLDAFTGKPRTAFSTMALRIIGPRGDQAARIPGEYRPLKGKGLSAGFKWNVPKGTAGGVYSALVELPDIEVSASREFEVRAWQPPRLKTEVTFARDGYGPGDRVSALCSVVRAEGDIPAGAAVDVIARVDGYEFYRGGATVGADGFVTAAFDLPGTIDKGLGTLSFVIHDAGRRETASKSLPILLQNLDLSFYPEGGDMVAGLDNRVYVEARQPNGKPADLSGRILDKSGLLMAELETVHEGRGSFVFTPQAGKDYHLVIDQPAGISRRFPLPAATTDGVVLKAQEVDEDGVIHLELGSDRDRDVLVVISQREREAARQRMRLFKGGFEALAIEPPKRFDGVLIATVFDSAGKPLAERLVFRRPEQYLDVRIDLERVEYIPGEKVTFKVRSLDKTGQPISASVGVTVTDSSVLEAIETRERAPGLEPAALLEAEVAELRDTAAYLDRDDAQASLHLDLLLATQGWRRFAFMDFETFLEEYGDPARRVIAFVDTAPPHKLLRMRLNDGVEFAAEPQMVVVNESPVVGAAPVLEAEALPESKAKQDFAVVEAPEEAVQEKREPMPDLAPRQGRERPAVNELIVDRNFFRRNARVGVPFRIYAHQADPDRKPGVRKDFTETLYWNAGLKTDKKGEAVISFELSDQITAFAVSVDAWSDEGALGSAYDEIRNISPFYVEPTLPQEISTNDRIDLPVAVTANSGKSVRTQIELTTGGKTISKQLMAGKNEAGRVRIPLSFEGKTGEHEIVIDARAGELSDRVVRKLKVVPHGFPVDHHFSGQVDADQNRRFELAVPANTLHVETHAEFFPTPLANMTSALKRLIREPYGCFEQTSSTSYPLVMAQQYFQSHADVDPRLVRDAADKLKKAYDRLVGFECKEKGYEWFGGDPGHEALTAYGLMQFHDMQDLVRVDTDMVTRTRAWLLSRRNGEGGYKRNQRALDSFGGAPAQTTDAYITWALVKAGESDLKPELDHLAALSNKTEDTYVLALAASALTATGRRDAAMRAMENLVKHQDDNGSVGGAVSSITRSRGQSLLIETTALAALAWMEEAAHLARAHKAVTWLFETCEGGMFGSTQGTILALKAITAYESHVAQDSKPGEVSIWVDGKPAGEPIAFAADAKDKIVLPDFSHLLQPGKTHRIELRQAGGSKLPFALEVRLRTPQPNSSDQCRLNLEVALSNRLVDVGEVTEVNVAVINRTAELLPTPVAVIGLPGGLEPRHDQLKELVRAGTIDAYEIRGREVICYWRALPKSGRIEFPISVTARTPGAYTAPASRAYEYYTSEHKIWRAGPALTIR